MQLKTSANRSDDASTSLLLIYIANQDRTVTSGEISKLKHQHLMYLAKLFDNNPEDVIQIENAVMERKGLW